MFRLILLIAALLIIGQLLRIGLRQLRGPGSPRDNDPDADPFEVMTQCPHCGVHVPKVTLDAGGVCPECHQ
ncbi:hypothetical protein [Polycyclovorans algicola]|uniref:hypothetical protein n=1 Tax=Polycyclovorans algicola TaxID=616992 RepID=UPI001268FA11|nr:hypothetical protein [Polycyclovorans algicola]